MCDPTELVGAVIAAVIDGGGAARDYVEATARASNEMETIFLCHGALANWGGDGLQLIVDIALQHRTVKSKSAALTLLVSLAYNGALPVRGHYALPLPLDPGNLGINRINPLTIRAPARQALRLLVLSLPDDELLLPLHQSMLHLHLSDAGVQRELVGALSARWLRIGPTVLALYERLLVDAAGDEATFHRFFLRLSAVARSNGGAGLEPAGLSWCT